jgi:hypothetical protein
MTQELKFEQIKDEVKGLIEETLKNNLDVEYIDTEQQQKVNDTIAEINQKLHSTYPGYKFVVCGTSFKKAHAGLNYASGCFWNPAADGSVMGRFENDYLHAFVTVAGIPY